MNNYHIKNNIIILTFNINICIMTYVDSTGCGSVWLERHLREVEAAGSNPVTPINLKDTVGLEVLRYFLVQC